MNNYKEMAYTQMTLIMFLNKLQEEKEKRVPFKKLTNLLIQIETFGWLHAWSEPRHRSIVHLSMKISSFSRSSLTLK